MLQEDEQFYIHVCASIFTAEELEDIEKRRADKSNIDHENDMETGGKEHDIYADGSVDGKDGHEVTQDMWGEVTI